MSAVQQPSPGARTALNQALRAFSALAALRQALRTIGADKRWPLKVAAGGALLASGLGLPFAQGYLLESIEMIQRGFPTPLPPWEGWGEKFRAGLLALLVDFAYFVLPLLGLAALLFCAGGLLGVAGPLPPAAPAALLVAAGALLLLVFGLGASPLGKLGLLQTEGLVGELGQGPVRAALRRPGRVLYMRARMATLPAYLPVLLTLALLWVLPPSPTLLLQIPALWALGSTLFLAHLVVMQVYAAAEQALRRALFEARVASQHADEAYSNVQK